MKVRKKYVLVLLLLPFLILCSKKKSENTLKVDEIFSDEMVFQRNHKIPVWGTVNPKTKVEAVFNGINVTTTSDENGYWKLYFDTQKAGGPFLLKVSSENKVVEFNDILIGEVWLASGQSNMHLDLERTLNGAEVAKKAHNSNIRIYNMKPIYPTGKDGVHTLEELNKIQNNNYFSTKGWVKVTPENVLNFSAVAYYFAEKLQGELNIPIGIIHNAVPGSPIESWMSEDVIEQDSAVNNFVKHRWDKKEKKDHMVFAAKNQLVLSKIKNQKHPWMSSYNYVNGISPIKNTPIKGVIWYQGESNGEQPKLYKTMFKKMIASWRSDFNSNFSFYYAQLTSREDRTAWPEFRNAQRESLNEVTNTKMAIITDVGDRQDTHAKNKKPVGERLALLALGDTYNIEKDYESPLFDKITSSENNYLIHFKGAFSNLKIKNSKDIIGFEISDDNINFEALKPTIKNKSVTFSLSKKYKKPVYIRYAWKSYTEANLISNTGLPASTFRAKIEE